MRYWGLIFILLLGSGCLGEDKGVNPAEGEIMERHSTEELDKCSNKMLSFPLVEVGRINSITSLGNLNPPEHTLPTQHMYIMLNSVGVNLYSPGDLKVTEISSNEVLGEGKKDFGMTLSLCDDVYIYFLHIKELSSELSPLLEGAECFRQSEKYEHCYKNLNKEEYALSAGEYIGTVGSTDQTNFDFGAFDYRHKNEFANIERYPSRGPYIVCPLDLYLDDVKGELYGLLDLTREPRCCRIMHDVPGTLKGNWFYGDVTPGSLPTWGSELSFADNNHDFPEAMISVGGVFTNNGRWGFTPEHSGFINRAFDEVAPDGNIYCYMDNEKSGRIIVELESETDLIIEHQDGSCSEGLGFTNPTTYKR